MSTLERYVALNVVVEITGVSKSTIYRLPGFPQPKKFGGSSRWNYQDVLAWIEAQPTRSVPNQKGL